MQNNLHQTLQELFAGDTVTPTDPLPDIRLQISDMIHASQDTLQCCAILLSLMLLLVLPASGKLSFIVGCADELS